MPVRSLQVLKAAYPHLRLLILPMVRTGGLTVRPRPRIHVLSEPQVHHSTGGTMALHPGVQHGLRI